MVHVRNRGRVPRLDYAREVTAVQVREVALSDMEPFDLPGLRDGGHRLHEGSLWAPVGHGTVPASADDLASFLECRPDIGDRLQVQQVQRAFVRTPLTLSPEAGPRGMFTDGFGYERGDDIGPSRTMVRDGRKEASRRVADCVDRDFLLADGGLYRRVAPYALVHRHESAVHTGIYVEASDRRGIPDFRSLPCAPGEAAAVAALLLRGKGGTEVRGEGLDRLADLPAGASADADVLVVANVAPGALRYLMDRDLRRDEGEEHMEAMRSLETRGRLWWVDGDEAEAALPRIAAAAEFLASRMAARWREDRHDHGVPALATVIREVYMPRFDRRRAAGLEQDAEFLAEVTPW